MEKTYIVRYTDGETTTEDYKDGPTREAVRRVFARQYPKLKIRAVVEAS